LTSSLFKKGSGMQFALNGPSGRTALESTVLTIGSSPDNLLVIDNVKVSAHHAEIRPEEHGYSITDLGSIHGTYVNGERLDFNTPRMLGPGNSIAIGDAVFTYVVKDEDQAQPPLSSATEQARTSGMPSSDEETLPGQTAYGVGMIDMPPGTEQPYMQPVYPGGVTPSDAVTTPGYVPATQERRKNHLLLWIGLGLGLLVVIGLAIGGYFYFTRSTPEKTLDAYCKALLGQDYLTAYNQLSTSLQTTERESQFAHTLEAQGRITSCTHGSVNINGATALVDLVFLSSSGQSSNSPITLTQDSGNTWKISVPFPPSVTLNTYCYALKNKDYQTAYDQFSSNIKNQVSESNYETNEGQGESSVGGITKCTVSNVSENGTSASGTITFFAGNGQSGASHYMLTNEAGFWKINGIQ
jgi:pSer/pThr/pTyr-binding forkhead associated (FHA) protein